MKFADGVVNAYNKKWSYINSFRVDFDWSSAIKNIMNWTEDDYALEIISIDTPQMTNSPIETFVGNRWKIHNGRDELYRFSITFRDRNQLELYNKLVIGYHYQKTAYFENIKSNISLWKLPDYYEETEKKIYEFQNVMIDSISQIQFNTTTTAQIVEFTVQFKCTVPEINIDIINQNK